jgi:hypothetical protein
MKHQSAFKKFERRLKLAYLLEDLRRTDFWAFSTLASIHARAKKMFFGRPNRTEGRRYPNIAKIQIRI